ncbi:MAG: glycosyltransferase family 39 protein [candidate division WWE3 bacterium]|nr:glycosyltransferase family 39 protein [candidate division WWE3 bacterium]
MPKLKTSKWPLSLLLVGLFVLTVAIRIPVLRSVGETWDEYAVVYYGETYYSAFKNLDFSVSSWEQNYEHPPVAKYIYGLSRQVTKKIPFIKALDSEYHSDKEYTLPRVVSAIFGGLTVVLVFLIGSTLFNRKIGLASSLILSVLPHFIAYTSIASLESIFIFFTTFFIYCLIKALKSNNWRWHLATVIALTLSFATRFNGTFFVALYAVIIVFFYRQQLLKLKFKEIPWPVLLSPIIFLGLFFALWPWLWITPFNIIKTFQHSSGGHTGEYFLGSLGQPGWYYYIVYFLVTTPEVMLVLFGIFIYTLIRKLASWKLEVGIRSWKYFLLLAWFLTPFLASFVAFKQNGIRYAVYFMPALALMSGVALIKLLDAVKKSIYKIMVAVIAMVGLLYPVVLFYPYYLDYYNLASGGPKAAYENRSFVISWWGEGGLAAVRYINQNAPRGAVVRTLFTPAHTLIKFRDDLAIHNGYDPLGHDDYILTNTYYDWYGNPKNLVDLKNYKVVYGMATPNWSLFSAPLVRVYKRVI